MILVQKQSLIGVRWYIRATDTCGNNRIEPINLYDRYTGIPIGKGT